MEGRTSVGLGQGIASLTSMRIVSILIFSTLFGCSSSARILGFFPLPSISHQFVFRQLMLELNRRGHDITVVTTDPVGVKIENYTEIDTHFVYEPVHSSIDLLQPLTGEKFMWKVHSLMPQLMDVHLSHESVKQLLRTGQFDLIFVEHILLPSLYPLSRHFGAPFIGIASLDLPSPLHTSIGNPFNPAYYPATFLTHTDKKDFYERLRSAVYFLFLSLAYKYYWMPQHEALVRKHFGEDIPHVGNIEKDVSMAFAYTDFRTWFPFPMVPAYLQIGGGRPFHIGDLQPLPQDLKKFLDDAKDGVIYFSLGSNVKSKAMPESKRQIFMKAFSRLKQKVLWKWEADDLPGKPENVKIAKWLPQTEVLAHPNVKAFITQGGLQSISEAVFFNVPMVVIPFFADQELNAKKLVLEEVAVQINYESLELNSFLAAIDKIVNDIGYKERIAKYSALTQDQPQSPLERAVWWTEYVLRHKGAKHLRSPAVDVPWYQYFLLDVFAFILVVSSITLYTVYKVLSFTLRLLFGKNKVKKE